MPEYIPTSAAAIVIKQVNKIARSPSFSSISSIITPNNGAKVILVIVISVSPMEVLMGARNTIPNILINQTHITFPIIVPRAVGSFSSSFSSTNFFTDGEGLTRGEPLTIGSGGIGIRSN